jgi:hypothetical protein
MAAVRRDQLWRPTVRVRWRCVAGACVALSLGAVSAGWAAAPTWTVTPTPTLGPSQLMSVSCASPSACTAVGVTGGTGFGNGKVLAERWNGERWSVQPTPLRASQSLFWDVSCGSAHFCAATGSVVFGSGSSRAEVRPFVGIWNGSRWRFRVRASSDIPGAVSCTSPRFCVLTGGQKPVVWDGSRWLVMSVARKASGIMGPVSCLSATACIAIVFNFSADGAPGNSAVSVRWNGRTWSALAPIPPGEIYDHSVSADVSCASLRACVVVLSTYNAYEAVLSWNGRLWGDAPALLYQDPNATPEGVSCGSPTVCTIVGTNYSGGFVARLADGSAQLQQAAPPPGPSGNRVDLNGVSCVNAICMAVGDSADETGITSQTLAEQYR